MIDPKTGMLQGENVPTLSQMTQEQLNLHAARKGGFKGNCFNCGKPGHRAVECIELKKTSETQPLAGTEAVVASALGCSH